MFGAFKSTMVKSGGYLWKFAPKLSQPQKYRLRKRMQLVDANIDAIHKGLLLHQLEKGVLPGVSATESLTGYKKLDHAKYTMPKESEMSPEDKYSTFNPNSKDYRRSLHREPKWTKRSFRENPTHF